MIYFSSKTGLKIVMKPEQLFRDKFGNPRKVPGRYIKFENGKYETDSPEEIAFMKEYAEKWKGEITIVDPKKIERDKKIYEKAKKMIEEEDSKEQKRLKVEEHKKASEYKPAEEEKLKKANEKK